jgi:NADH:ubiquinone oxidoreductase subunit 5 (subunit L)/multisubunit Na+/H+ antiporter MnhA subunit
LPGVGAFTAGIFHVMTHAFFKALLFLGQARLFMVCTTSRPPDGRLEEVSPITFATMAAGWLAISGFPLFSGFFSKDEISGVPFDDGATGQMGPRALDRWSRDRAPDGSLHDAADGHDFLG